MMDYFIAFMIIVITVFLWDWFEETKQEDKRNQEKFRTHMQIKHAKIQLKNYYHMVDNKIKIIRQKFKEGEYKWQE